ncbi:hypothetical protein HK096_008409, partial [Nowakowskiella sp. JEL0078]
MMARKPLRNSEPGLDFNSSDSSSNPFVPSSRSKSSTPRSKKAMTPTSANSIWQFVLANSAPSPDSPSGLPYNSPTPAPRTLGAVKTSRQGSNYAIQASRPQNNPPSTRQSSITHSKSPLASSNSNNSSPRSERSPRKIKHLTTEAVSTLDIISETEKFRNSEQEAKILKDIVSELGPLKSDDCLRTYDLLKTKMLNLYEEKCAASARLDKLRKSVANQEEFMDYISNLENLAQKANLKFKEAELECTKIENRMKKDTKKQHEDDLAEIENERKKLEFEIEV